MLKMQTYIKSEKKKKQMNTGLSLECYFSTMALPKSWAITKHK